jgi:hypothetical protein
VAGCKGVIGELKGFKIYFYDYCKVEDEGLRFENMVAVELSRAVTLWSDFGFGEYDLWYLRNKDKEEIDFLVTENGNPLFMVEAKLSDTAISSNLIKIHRFRSALISGFCCCRTSCLPVSDWGSQPRKSSFLKNRLNCNEFYGLADIQSV